jgi:hypothetical protein
LKSSISKFAPVSVLLQLLVDASRFQPVRVHAPPPEAACTWFRSGGGSFMELLTV